MASRRPPLDRLEAAVGHRFANRRLLEQALTHVSGADDRIGSYQRLEFLGDRVLGLIVAGMLFETFPGAEEGELSRRLAELVRRETCAEVAKAWDVAPHLRLAAGGAFPRARQNVSVLADVCEAIVGAVYLDGGHDAAAAVVRAAFGPLMHAPRRSLRDAKTTLQEWAHARGLPNPGYELVETTGPDHAPVFTISTLVQGYPPCLGKGPSKRAAEQDAASQFLAREGVTA
ncbi:ribonuclease III [Camelimonas abortus]|uniref:Ribonuclease 3 n=1 Tax=Camelimonas abortus TaxID=1017184 RepID=A0ABV7LBN8_9HYPH